MFEREKELIKNATLRKEKSDFSFAWGLLLGFIE